MEWNGTNDVMPYTALVAVTSKLLSGMDVAVTKPTHPVHALVREEEAIESNSYLSFPRRFVPIRCETEEPHKESAPPKRDRAGIW